MCGRSSFEVIPQWVKLRVVPRLTTAAAAARHQFYEIGEISADDCQSRRCFILMGIIFFSFFSSQMLLNVI